MTAQRELEIKLTLPPETVGQVKKIPLIKAVKKSPKRSTELSVYFDTDKHKLRKHGLMLRVRRIGNRYLQTIKADGNAGPFERGEWESEIADGEPDLSLARKTPLKPIMSRKLRRQLKPMFETRVHRTVYPIVNRGHLTELAVDKGKIDAGGSSLPLCELELELKSGNEAELFSVARKLLRELPVQLALKSKSQRGYELIDGALGAPVRAVTANLAVCASAREGFRAIGSACLRQIIDNEPAVIKGDSEGVHQMRVGLRRLRVAMSLFSALLQDSQTAKIKDKLKWLTGELTPAREVEVLVKRVVKPLKKKGAARRNGMPALLQDLTAKRKAALERAQNAITTARFRSLTLEVAAWLETGNWTKPEDDLVRSRGDMPIEHFAAEQLARRWRKVRKKGKTLARLDARDRHKLRIQVKKLRYAAEFFGELFRGKRASKRRRKFIVALEHLQDGLGDLNDIMVDEKLITAAGLKHRRASPKRAFAAGLLTGREDASADAAMAAATDSYTAVAASKHFW
jgi:inorganic triphosphatase YgiF